MLPPFLTNWAHLACLVEPNQFGHGGLNQTARSEPESSLSLLPSSSSVTRIVRRVPPGVAAAAVGMVSWSDGETSSEGLLSAEVGPISSIGLGLGFRFRNFRVFID